jgi:hypothetical protein
MTSASQAWPVVFIVDDDEGLRGGLERLLRSVGLRSETFASTLEFTRCRLPDAANCLLLHVRLPGMSGLASRPTVEGAGPTLCHPLGRVDRHHQCGWSKKSDVGLDPGAGYAISGS